MTAETTETKSIGRYLVDGMIGEGAMAEVFKAYDPEIDRTVAIKVLKDALCIDEEYMNRFLREARAAGAISHPNIVTIFDVGRVGRKPYITMEFLEELTLSDLLEKNEKIPLKRIVSIGIQLAQALDYAHRLGIIHRDIKPANILFMRGSENIKVADFGIARRDSGDDMGKTHAGTVLGTPRYMSPEQALGDKIDGRSDLFSVGVILYELFTGAKAFNASTMTSLLLQITQQDPEPIKKTAPELPVGLQRIVTKLLNKRPEKRYQTGAELAEALQRELNVLLDQEQEAAANKYIPLKVKWAAGMGGILAVFMIAAMFTVFHFQGKAIQEQELDSGSSLAKFIATESAIPVLSEDWIRLETFVQDASERDTFANLAVVDHTGTIRAASDPSLAGKPYVAPKSMEILKRSPDVTASSVELANGASVFSFDTPILFQNKEVGRIYMSTSKAGLDRVMAITRLLMMGVVVLTVAAVVVMLYVFGGLIAKPMKRLRQVMLAVAAGDFDQRISEVRRDEIGELFNTFNRMTEALSGLVAKHAAEAANVPDVSSRPIPAMWRDDDDSPSADGDLTTISAGPAVRPVIDATLIAPAGASAPAPSSDNPFLEADPFNENEPVHENDPFADAPDDTGAAARSKRSADHMAMTRILTRLASAMAFAALVAGCATEQVRVEAPRETVVARTDEFVLVRAGAKDTPRTLAKTYLNDENKFGAITSANATETFTPGQIVAIPLRTGKAWTVDADGYQVVPILCYHQFGAGNRARNKMEVSQNAFEQQMAFLKEHGYTVISLSDMHAFLSGAKALPEKAVVITIDDGYRSTYDIAFPILKKYGFPATVYVYSDFLGAGMALTWAQMSEMESSGLIDVESHSKTHTSMALLPNESNGPAYKDRITKEIVTPGGVLSSKLGKPITHFAYPYGDTSPTALSILQDRGYATATTVQRGGNPSFADPLILRRDMVYSDDKLSDFQKYVAVRVDMKLR